jgi:hypothetical protein
MFHVITEIIAGFVSDIFSLLTAIVRLVLENQIKRGAP